VRADTVKNSLNKARTHNLPPDKPGIVFVKVPQIWLEPEDVRKGIYAAVAEFLRNTERIVSVAVYATVTTELAEQKKTPLRHRFNRCLRTTRPPRNGAERIRNGCGCSRRALSSVIDEGNTHAFPSFGRSVALIQGGMAIRVALVILTMRSK
jgi:hypothetical protein